MGVGWRKRGWKTASGTDVLTGTCGSTCRGLVDARARGEVDWRWVRGHVGTRATSDVDEIAVAFALQQPADLYTGRSTAIPCRFSVTDDRRSERSAGSTSGSKSRGPAHSILSVVDGVPMRHGTWAELQGA